MTKILALAVALGVFAAWLSVVGNPHVVETVIGLVLAIVAGLWAYFQLKKLTGPRN